MASLIGFQHPNHYAHYLIKPARKTFDALIVKEWPNIQRILTPGKDSCWIVTHLSL
jgi:hypothetical protein